MLFVGAREALEAVQRTANETKKRTQRSTGAQLAINRTPIGEVRRPLKEVSASQWPENFVFVPSTYLSIINTLYPCP
jgi:hypothetical protein